jgi:hypothetical protein
MPTAVARRYVPQALPLIPIAPGRTLATVAFASYERGSLAYRELLLGIGLVWLRGPRFCIPRLWVDSDASIAGGREIWKLPKEFASFDVQRNGDALVVEAHGICRIDASLNRYGVPLWLPALAFGQSSDVFYPFNAYTRARTSFAHVRITALSDELAAVQLERPVIAMYYQSMDVSVHGPGVGMSLSRNL